MILVQKSPQKIKKGVAMLNESLRWLVGWMFESRGTYIAVKAIHSKDHW